MGCDTALGALTVCIAISIHASRMGCDKTQQILGIRFSDFNPRIPYGMRPDSTPSKTSTTHFNPRIPYEMRRLEQ